MSNWLTHQGQYYRAHRRKWAYIEAHLTADVVDRVSMRRGDDPRLTDADAEEVLVPGAGSGQTSQKFYRRRIAPLPGLKQREMGEPDSAFRERFETSSYRPDFTHACTTLAGMVFAVEDKAHRSWGELGDEKEAGSDAFMLSRDADGAGRSWAMLCKEATVDLTGYLELWGRVEGVRLSERGIKTNAGRFEILLPQMVDRVIERGGRPVEVKVPVLVETAQKMEDEPTQKRQYYVYRLDGRYIYEDGDDGEPALVEFTPYGGADNPAFRYYADQNREEEILPIFRVRVPIRGLFTYVMARWANSLYNLKSARDFHLWSSAFSRILLDVIADDGSIDETTLDLIRKSITDGDNVWPGAGHLHLTPPMEGAEMRSKTLEEETEAFYRAFFQMASDRAKERTATEISQEFRAGVEAFLQMLSAALDKLENQALWLLEQVNLPDSPGDWGEARVERSRDFQPLDIDAMITRAIEQMVPGKVLPVPASAISELAARALERLRIPVDEDVRDELLKLAEEMVGSESAVRQGRVDATEADQALMRRTRQIERAAANQNGT